MDEEKQKAHLGEFDLEARDILSQIQEISEKYLEGSDFKDLGDGLKLFQSELEMHIEQLKKAQKNLDDSRRRYFDLYNMAPVACFTLSTKGLIAQVNLTGADLLGVPRRILKGARFTSYVIPSWRDHFHSHIMEIAGSKEKKVCELKMKTVEGSEFWAEVQSIPDLDEAGELKSIRTAVLDVSERRKAEVIERTLRDIVHTIPDALIIHDFTGNILAWNNGAMNMYGYKQDEALKMNIDIIIPSLKKREMIDIRHRLKSGEKTISIETLRKSRTGKILHVNASFSAQLDPNGRPDAISSIERDITLRKRIEAERSRLIRQLVREQKLLETIISQLPVGVLIAEPPDGKVIIKNSMVDQIFGLASEMPESYEEYGTQRKIFYSDGRQYPPEDIPLLRAMKKGERVENEIAEFERGDGSRGMINLNASPVRDEDGEIIAGIVTIQDITSQVEKEQRTIESRDFADNIIASMRDGLLVLDENMEVVHCNRSFCEIFDVKAEDINGRIFSEIGEANWDIPELRWLLERLHEKTKAINDYEVVKKFPGIGRRFMIINGRPVLGGEGKPDLILLTFKDVTEQRAAEEEIQRLNAMLLKRYVELQNANRELEAFTYSVSHDLRGPLRAMDGFSRLMQEEYSDKVDEKGRHYLERVRSGASSMAELIDDLLRLSRISQSDIVYTDVNLSKIAMEFAEELKQSNTSRNIIFDVQPDLIAKGDHNLLKQLLENLIRNAWKYSQEKPEAKIEFGMREVDGERTYYVRDNGAGFDMKYADKLFMPFQRLHSSREYSGTGIGLSIVKRIVDGHDGKVWAEAKEGAGATFYFTLGNQEE